MHMHARPTANRSITLIAAVNQGVKLPGVFLGKTTPLFLQSRTIRTTGLQQKRMHSCQQGKQMVLLLPHARRHG